MQNVMKILALLVFVLGLSLGAKENKFSASIALVGMSMDYREYNSTGNILDSEMSGFNELPGLDIGLKYLLNEALSSYMKLEVNVMALSGYTDYVGSLRNPPGQPYGSHTSRTVNNIIDFDIKVKRYHQLDNRFIINYGLGLGYRYWERILSVSQVEIYEWYSLRAMLGMNFKLTNKFKLGTEFEYQYGFNETMSASDIGSTFDLAGADILKFSIPLVYSYNDKMDFIASYVYEKQTIKESNHIPIGIHEYWEPDSTAKNQYIKIGLDFKY